jgi:hypothetical protein
MNNKRKIKKKERHSLNSSWCCKSLIALSSLSPGVPFVIVLLWHQLGYHSPSQLFLMALKHRITVRHLPATACNVRVGGLVQWWPAGVICQVSLPYSILAFWSIAKTSFDCHPQGSVFNNGLLQNKKIMDYRGQGFWDYLMPQITIRHYCQVCLAFWALNKSKVRYVLASQNFLL